MRVVVTLLVRDEIDVIAATVEHYLAAGAAHLVVTDNGSVDGTAELLERYERAGALQLIHEYDWTYDQSRWVTRMARLAATDHGADWVVNADADEFLWPCDPSRAATPLPLLPGPTVDLVAALARIPAHIGTIVARRQNLLADPDATGAWPRRLYWREEVSRSDRGTPIGPKTIHRADPDVVVQQGNHAVAGPLIGAEYDGEPLVFLQVPDRGYEQFERKIRNGGSSYAANTELPPDTGWHWREDYQRLTDGTLRQTWLSRQLDRATIERRCLTDDLVEDHRLAERIDLLTGQAVLPAALDEFSSNRPDTRDPADADPAGTTRRQTGRRRLRGWLQRSRRS